VGVFTLGQSQGKNRRKGDPETPTSRDVVGEGRYLLPRGKKERTSQEKGGRVGKGIFEDLTKLKESTAFCC